MPRFEPLPKDAWPDQMQAALEAMTPPTPRHYVPPPGGRPDRPKASAVMGTFARHPDLAETWLRFNGHVLYGTTLTLRQREILVLRVAMVRKSPYLWAQHLVHKEEADLSDEDVALIAQRAHASLPDPLEAALVRSVDELVETGSISSTTWAQLSKSFDERQLLDTIFTVGCYDTLSALYKSMDYELERDLDAPEP